MAPRRPTNVLDVYVNYLRRKLGADCEVEPAGALDRDRPRHRLPHGARARCCPRWPTVSGRPAACRGGECMMREQCTEYLNRRRSPDLHDLSQPLTRLQWRLELGRRPATMQSSATPLKARSPTHVELIEWVRRIRVRIDNGTQRTEQHEFAGECIPQQKYRERRCSCQRGRRRCGNGSARA